MKTKTMKAWALVKDGEIPANFGNLYIYETMADAERNPDGVVHDEIAEVVISFKLIGGEGK
jgi:hypothetical protein